MKAVEAVRRLLAATVGRFFRLLLTGGILGYRKLFSPMLGPRCRFHPSCSSYALEAISVHGAGKGTVLATWRICRCNPWNPGGVDLVPVKGRWTPDPYVPLESGGTAAEAGTAPTGPDRNADDRSAA
jgi:putative membrane protein insertion efficiency factor